MDHTTHGSDARRSGRFQGRRLRIFAPLLTLAMLMAALVNPGAASAAEETGPGPCGERPTFAVAGAGLGLARADDDCCDRPEATLTAGLRDDCREEPRGEEEPPPPTPTPEPPAPETDDAGDDPTPEAPAAAPAKDLVPPPPPLRGPTWMGPITPQEAPQVTLKVPPLLAIFLARHEVVVTSPSGGIVFKGVIPPNRMLMLANPSVGGDGDYTVTGTLIRGSKYTEVVTVGDSEVN